MDKYQNLRNLSPMEVLSALGVDVSTFKKRSGKMEWFGRCPMPGHNPKHNTTSFSLNADGRYQCFGCSEKGKGNIDLTKAIRQCGFQQAVEFLQGYKPSADIKKEAVEPLVSSEGVLKPYARKYEKFKADCAWLNARVPDKAIQERFGVFQYLNNGRKSQYNGRVLIPFKDVEGVLWGYMGRDITGAEGVAKYLVPANFPKSRFLFGAAEVKSSHSLPVKVLYVVESAFCVMKFASLGLPAVAAYGWSVSDTQVQLLQDLARGVVYLPDSNKYQQSGETLSHLAARLWLRFPPLPAGCEDPESLSKEQILAL